jgi:hypothetical protein
MGAEQYSVKVTFSSALEAEEWLKWQDVAEQIWKEIVRGNETELGYRYYDSDSEHDLPAYSKPEPVF